MKIVQLYTPKDFDRLDKVLMYDVWYRQALTDKQVGKLFGVKAADVKQKRAELGVRWMNSAIASISGGSTFTSRDKLIETRAPKDWDGNPIPFRPGKHRSIPQYTDYEAEGNALDPAIPKKVKPMPEPVDELSREDAARAWQELKQQEQEEKDTMVNIDAQVSTDGQLTIDGVEYDLRPRNDDSQSE